MAQVQAPSFFGAPEGPAPGSSSVALPPLSKQKSLLSELLRDTTVAMMDGTHMEDLGEEDMEEGDYDEEGSETEECSEEGEEDGDDCMEEDTDCPASGSRPIKIRRPSS